MEIFISIIQNTGHIVLYYLLPFIIVLGVMIFFHELGHFMVAKYFGVKVLKFALGFGPKIIGKEMGETEYSIRYFPLGGFVKMLGEDDDDEEIEAILPEEMERAFHNQHPLKRIAIVAAGPIFNLLLALFLFCGLFLFSGNYIMIPEIGEVRPGSPAERAGMKSGDIVVIVQGEIIQSWDDIKEAVMDRAGKPVELAYKRAGKIFHTTITPEESAVKNEFGEEIKTPLIGIVSAGKFEKLEMGPGESIKEAFQETWKWIKLTLLVVIKLFQGIVSIKTVGGPIMIGQITGKLAQESLSYLIPFMAIISINLGILNLFPIPILDGGVIVFLLIELAIGKPLSIRKREIAQKVGLSLLIILMAVVFYNDLLRLFE